MKDHSAEAGVKVTTPGNHHSNIDSGVSTSVKQRPGWLRSCFMAFFEYETPKVVTVKSIPLGILRMLLQVLVVSFVVFYQLWYARGYQEFVEVEASVTTKVKGFSRSELLEEYRVRMSPERAALYERVWDESDYVVPPAENMAFFVMTNAVITPNQTRGVCPEDSMTMREDITCSPSDLGVASSPRPCRRGRVVNSSISHGPETGRCVVSDREPGLHVCEVESWCPVEMDVLPMPDRPLITGVQNYTVFIKSTISFSRFDAKGYRRHNMPNGICTFDMSNPGPTKLCPVFRLGDIVSMAGGNFSRLAVKGGVISIELNWDCDLDWDFMKHCLPQYSFRILDETGWNFRHAYYHEENRRTLIKSYGLKFLLVVEGQAARFSVKNTVIVLVTGLGLLGLSTMLCDFILLNYSSNRSQVKAKKYETVEGASNLLQSTFSLLAHTSTVRRGEQQAQGQSRTGANVNIIEASNVPQDGVDLKGGEGLLDQQGLLGKGDHQSKRV